MVAFDRIQQFQFVLFFRPSPFSAVAPQVAGELVSRLSEGAPRLGLKFGPAQVETALSPTGPTQALAWTAAGGIWRMVLTSQRLDLHFDALGYSDIAAEEDISVATVSRRVQDNLGAVTSTFGPAWPVHRAALVLTAQGTAASEGSQKVEREARGTLRDGAVDVGAADVTIRLNRTVTWRLGEADWLVNRIENLAVDTTFQADGTPEKVFLWGLDVNTSPANGLQKTLSDADVRAFFEQAKEWIASRFEGAPGHAH